MPLPTRTIRLFVSSPFNDLKAERNALQAEVFPRLHQHCQANGWSFQAIDLRWGVSTEAALDQSAMRICLAEIARCQAVTPRPNFLVLLGDRYGWRPLPDAVPAVEFDALSKHLPTEIVEQLLWREAQSEDNKGWYRLDENAVVALPDHSGQDRGVYLLQPRTGRFMDDGAWSREVEQPLGAALRRAAQAEWLDTADARRLKFEASATEQEIVAGALTAPDAHEHVSAFFRRIDLADGVALRDAVNTGDPHGNDPRPYKDFVDLLDGDRPDARPDEEAMARLQVLKRRLSQHIDQREPEYVAHWQDGGLLDGHLPQFVDDVYASLFELIDAQIKTYSDAKPTDEEPFRHWAFAERRARDFTGRKEDLSIIDAYVHSTGSAPPFIVQGESGTGKSALMSEAALRLRGPGNSTVIARFIGATPASGDARSLLEGLCRELGTVYGASNDNLTLDVNRLAVEFRQRLELATAERPLLLFIDALDQLPADSASVISWLPRELGPHLRIVVSTLPGVLLDGLMRELPNALTHDLLRMTSDEGRTLLVRWLASSNRRLTESQTERVIASFADTGSPLYLRLAFEAARLWPSHDNAPQMSNNVAEVINALFDRLSADSSHGPLLVNRVLGYLSCARQGLSENELLQLLARDDQYWRHFLTRSKHELPKGEDGDPVRQLPVVIWSRLYHELEPYLSWRSAHGATLMTFFHSTTFVPLVQSRSIPGDTELQQRHAAMATFFVGTARGELPAEPWSSDDVRGFAECIFHLVNAGDVNGSSQFLTDLAFVAGKVRHGLVFELINDYKLGIGALPEAQQELEEERRQRASLAHWGEAMADNARQWSRRRDTEALTGAPVDAPEPVLSVPPAACRMWTDSEIADEYKRLIQRPARVDRLRAFEGFVRSQCYPLLEHGHREGFVAQHAVAVLPGGVVNAAASALLVECRVPTIMRRWPSGSALNPKPAVLSTLEGHIARVNCVSVTPDGRRAVSGSADKTLRVWDLDSGASLRTLKGHGGSVTSVSVTPDGRRAVSGSADKTLRVWDLDSGASLRTLKGHGGSVTSVSVTPDRRRAVSGSWDHTLRVWDLDSGACLRTLEGHEDMVASVSVMPDGRHVVSVSGMREQSLRVWDLDSGTCLRILKGHGGSVTSVSITPDGQRAISGSWDHTLQVWDLNSGACLRTLEGHRTELFPYGIINVGITPDGRRAVSGGSGDMSLRVWDLDSGVCLRILEGHSRWVTSVSIAPDGRRGISGSDDSTLQVWDLNSGACLRTLEGHHSFVNCISVTPDGRRAVSGDDDKTLRIWDLDGGACLRTLEGHEDMVASVSVMPDGRHVVSVSGMREQSLRVWDLDSGTCLRVLGSHGRRRVTSVSITPDGQRAISGSFDKTLRVWDLDIGGWLGTLEGHGGPVTSVSVTPDGRRVVSGSQDRTLRVWDLDNGTWSSTLEGHDGWVTSVSVTPDGRRMVSGSSDKTLRVWDLRNGTCLRTLEGHSHVVLSVGVTPDGQRAISSDADKTLRVWDLACGLCLGVYSASASIDGIAIHGHQNAICAVTQSGEMLFLDIRGVKSGPAILTTTKIGDAWCRACGNAFRAPDAVIAAIRSNCSHLAPDQSPCLELPDPAFADQRLLSRCPFCDVTVKFNPFFSDGSPQCVMTAFIRRLTQFSVPLFRWVTSLGRPDPLRAYLANIRKKGFNNRRP